MGDQLIHIPRPQRAPLAAVARRIGFAAGLIVFVAIVVRFNASGYVDSTGDPIGFLDALYYASVTVTTTGYGDISAVTGSARLGAIILITPARVLFLILVVGTTVEVLTDQYRQYLATRRWRKSVRDHIVVCGYGSTGQSAVTELLNRGFAPDQVAIVDTDVAAIAQASDDGIVAIHGDATQNAVLEQAAVRDARSIIVAPNRDDTAVLIVLTVRELNPDIHVVAAVRERENLHLLRQAGSNEVIDATAAVGRMLGLATTAPGAVSVLDDLLDAGNGLELKEIVLDADASVPPGTTLVAAFRAGTRVDQHDVQRGQLRQGDRVIVLSEATAGSA